MHPDCNADHNHIDARGVRHCPRCGGALEDRFIEYEQRMRLVCSRCSFIHYLNPKVIAAAVPRQGTRIWLLRRSIEPALGKWTIPGGYVDLGEPVPDAAIRETREETCLDIRLEGLLNVYSYNDVGVVVIVYRATVTGGEAAITAESQEVRAFELAEIPWADLAFPSTHDALAEYVAITAGNCSRNSGLPLTK
jgi:ADP-ribose pyrophosphatase YjhB (NUDIX family)